MLADRIDDYNASRLIALLVLTEYGAKTDRHELVLDTLDNLYPHLFDDPPRDLDKDENGTFFVGQALLQSGATDRGLYLLNASAELSALGRLAYRTNIDHVVDSLVLGDKVNALARLAEIKERSRHSTLKKLLLERTSIFDPLREEPAFIALLDEYNQHAEEQRQLLQAMLENPAE